jgi:hypothetical protein
MTAMTVAAIDHEADADAARRHEHEHELAPAAPSGSVAIDVGAGRGALVLYPGERFRGREIEISRAGGSGPRVHTGVHERSTQPGSLLTAIFGSLPAGDYVVWEDATTEGPTVAVSDGAVAEVRLS